MGLRQALLDHPDVATVEGVVDHVTMQNPAVQVEAVTPDLYAWGKLKDGRSYEVVGDTKFKVI